MAKAVLNLGLPPPPPSLPTSLYRGDRLSATLVRDAVTWILAHEDGLPRTVPAISSRLQYLYFGDDQHRVSTPRRHSRMTSCTV
ncbi:hypothetical protein [Vitiosangium sp. GDMCC 1.1324]|uniref:hypothetical protein n=1 Tax=Vitiosangium sp. (strain GDMCC 1.1324) TaxID=2138576 RepID=UPI0011B65212|nr:hypothetical protein [Vitiosangium sp. GDMCC 1.1324]